MYYIITNTKQDQQEEEQRPIPEEEQPHEPVHAGGPLAGKQCGRQGPGGTGGHQVEHKSAMCREG